MAAQFNLEKAIEALQSSAKLNNVGISELLTALSNDKSLIKGFKENMSLNSNLNENIKFLKEVNKVLNGRDFETNMRSFFQNISVNEEAKENLKKLIRQIKFGPQSVVAASAEFEGDAVLEDALAPLQPVLFPRTLEAQAASRALGPVLEESKISSEEIELKRDLKKRKIESEFLNDGPENPEAKLVRVSDRIILLKQEILNLQGKEDKSLRIVLELQQKLKALNEEQDKLNDMVLQKILVLKDQIQNILTL